LDFVNGTCPASPALWAGSFTFAFVQTIGGITVDRKKLEELIKEKAKEGVDQDFE
jgi:hypothetical protein